MANVLNWPGGLTAAIVLALAGWMLVRATRDHRQTIRFQQALFLVAFGVRFGASIVIYAGGLVSILHDEDSSGWVGGVILMQRWLENGFSDLRETGAISALVTTENTGYQYLLAIFFTLTRLVGRLPATAFTSFISALGVVFVYRTARVLATERAARAVAAAVALLPIMVIWSSQTLKEPVVIALEAAALYACVRIGLPNASRRHILLALAIFIIIVPFRFYIAYALGVALVLATWRNWRGAVHGLAWSTATTVVVLTMLGLLTQQVFKRERPGLQRVQEFRELVAPGGAALGRDGRTPVVSASAPSGSLPAPLSMTPAPAVAQNGGAVPSPRVPAAESPRSPAPPPVRQPRATFDAREPAQIPLVLLVGSAYALLAPFPWQFTGGSLRLMFTAPDMILWWAIFFWVVVPGVWRALRTRVVDVAPLVIFLVLIGGLYSLMFANVGIAYRQRAQLVPVLLTLAAAGLAPLKRTDA